jgi:outer membrane protein OmpA-like peptidoglycan-associated protein
MRFSALPLLCLALLSGCSSSLKQLGEANPPATDFPSSLAAEYRAFAESEAEQGRSGAADHFATKGLRALHGVDVAPDALDPSLNDAQRAGLSEARAQLSALLNAEVKEAAPQELARAQLVFDCWQHQVVSGIAPDKGLCAGEFGPALNQVLAKAGPEVYGQALSRTITFAPHATRLSDENQTEINEIVCKLMDRGGDDFWVELRAYTGRKAAQRKLVEARVSNVKKALVKGGVPVRRIRTLREGAKAVMLSRDNMSRNTKQVTITITADTHAREAK